LMTWLRQIGWCCCEQLDKGLMAAMPSASLQAGKV